MKNKSSMVGLGAYFKKKKITKQDNNLFYVDVHR